MPRSLDARAEHLLRELAPQVLGAVIRRFRDFAASEDAVQEALIAAATQWPRDGLPDNPRGWLIQVASRRMTDHMRSELARRRREAVVAEEAELSVDSPSLDPWSSFGGASSLDLASTLGAATAADPADQDDTLVLLFMCCHPALTPASAIALTLRAVGGLTTAEIASAFLVPEATMAQRISRAKQSIKSSGVPFSLPTPEERANAARRRAARAVSHLQRGLHEQRRAEPAPERAVGRGDSADARRPSRCCLTTAKSADCSR